MNSVRLILLIVPASSAINGFLGARHGQWRTLLDAIAMGLLGIVFLLAMSGTGQLRAPRVGTRPLRFALYALTLGTSLVATLAWPLQPEASMFGFATTLCFIAAVLWFVVRDEMAATELRK